MNSPECCRVGGRAAGARPADVRPVLAPRRAAAPGLLQLRLAAQRRALTLPLLPAGQLRHAGGAATHQCIQGKTRRVNI